MILQVVAVVPVALSGGVATTEGVSTQVVAVTASGVRPSTGQSLQPATAQTATTPQQGAQQQQQQQKQNRITPVAKPGGLDPVIILQERENRYIDY